MSYHGRAWDAGDVIGGATVLARGPRAVTVRCACGGMTSIPLSTVRRARERGSQVLCPSCVRTKRSRGGRPAKALLTGRRVADAVVLRRHPDAWLDLWHVRCGCGAVYDARGATLREQIRAQAHGRERKPRCEHCLREVRADCGRRTHGKSMG